MQRIWIYMQSSGLDVLAGGGSCHFVILAAMSSLNFLPVCSSIGGTAKYV